MVDGQKLLPVNGRHLVLVPDDEEHAVVGQGRLDVAGQQRRAARHGLHLNGGACNKRRHKFFTCYKNGRLGINKESKRNNTEAPVAGNSLSFGGVEMRGMWQAALVCASARARPHIIAALTSINTFICGFLIPLMLR